MNEDEVSARFKISQDDDEKEAVYQSDADDLRIEKLSHRMTIISIIIPCLVIVILFLTYMDIKRRVTTTRDTGAIGVQNLTKDLESRFSVLSLKLAKLEESLSSQNTSAKKSSASVQVHLKKLEGSLKKRINAKADKKTVTAVKSTIGKSIDPIEKNIAGLSARMDKLNEELTAHLSLLSEQIKNKQTILDNLNAGIAAVKKDKITKEDLSIAIGIERLSLRKVLNDEMSAYHTKLQAVEKKTQNLLKAIQGIQSKLNKMGTADSAQAEPAPKPSTDKKPAAGASKPSSSDNLQEQSID